MRPVYLFFITYRLSACSDSSLWDLMIITNEKKKKKKKEKKDEKVKKELNLLNVWSSTFTLDYSMHWFNKQKDWKH